MSNTVTLPNVLTLIRLISSPIVLPFFIVYLLPFNLILLNSIVALLFIMLSVTDFFDGFLARAFKQESSLGRTLDPIADKFLLYATLVSLLAAGKISFIWVILLIGREFFVMGLRQVALEHSLSVKVSMLGKVKTTLQMIVLFLIIFNPYQQLGFHGCGLHWNALELLLLSMTTIVSILSAYRYYQGFMRAYYRIQESHEG